MYKSLSKFLNEAKEALNKVLLSNNNIKYNILDTSDNLTIISPDLLVVDFLIIIVLILVFRFIGIRCIIFIYILLIHKQCQLLCNILKINNDYINKIHEVLTKLEYNLILPGGNNIRYLFKTKTFTYTPAPTVIFELDCALKLPENRVNPFMERFCKTSVEKSYLTNLQELKYASCLDLLHKADFKQLETLYKVQANFVKGLASQKKIREIYSLSENNMKMLEFFIQQQNKILIDKLYNKENQISFLMHEDALYNLNGLDSSQNIERSGNFIVYLQQNMKKTEEILDLTKFIVPLNEPVMIVSVGDRESRADFFSIKGEENIHSLTLLNKKFNYPYEEIAQRIPTHSIIAHDVTRMNISTLELNPLIEKINKQKIYPLVNRKVPQSKHEICAVLQSSSSKHPCLSSIEQEVFSCLEDAREEETPFFETSAAITWKSILEIIDS